MLVLCQIIFSILDKCVILFYMNLLNLFSSTVVTEKKWKHFVDTGEISQKILMNISRKIMENEKLEEYEMFIFVSKTSEINEIIRFYQIKQQISKT